MVNVDVMNSPPIFPVPDTHIMPWSSWEREKPNGASQGRRQWAIVMTQLDSLLLMLQKSLRAPDEVGSLSMKFIPFIT